MSLLQVCQWLNDTQLATAIRESEIVFPLIEILKTPPPDPAAGEMFGKEPAGYIDPAPLPPPVKATTPSKK